MIRYVLAQTESQTRNTVISRAKMLQQLKEISEEERQKNIALSQLYDYIDSKLKEVYGYHLFGLEAKNNARLSSKKRKHSSEEPEENRFDLQSIKDVTSKGHSFVLVRSGSTSSLPQRYSQFLLDQTASLYQSKVIDDVYIGSEYTANYHATLDNGMGTDGQLALHGIIALTICIVILSKNNILETELVEYYEKFGIPCDGHEIPIINITVSELLNLLVRNNYLSRYSERSRDLAQEIVTYKVGKRTQVEFPRQSLLTMCQRFLGLPEDQLGPLRKTIEIFAADSYSSEPV